MRFNKKIKTVIVLLIAIIVSVPLGIVIANEHAEKYCYVVFRRQIVLAEDVVFEDGFNTNNHDGPLYITKGTAGYITDEANYNADDSGEEFIHAVFPASDGEFIDVLLSTDMPSDRNPSQLIDISKIESSQEVLSEYKQSREDLRTRIRNTRIAGALIGFAVSAVITVIVLVVNKKRSAVSD